MFEFTHWPTTKRVITQRFGENPQNYIQYGLPGHDGADIVAPIGSPIFAVASGEVYYVGYKKQDGTPSAYGWHVRLRHEGGYKTVYAHLAPEPPVSVGDIVRGGQVIGYSGNTGNSTGPHLHLTLKHEDGMQGWPYNIIDPMPYLDHLLATENWSLVGGHYQEPVPDWPQAVEIVPAVQQVFQVEMCREAKHHNPDCVTVVRHHVHNQSDFLEAGNKEQAARDFFSRFIDDTFTQYADDVDYVCELNEYFATGESPSSRWQKIEWVRAVSKVWHDEYMPAYPHIKLILTRTAIGNDIPVEVAEVAHQYGFPISYHCYIPVRNKLILDGEYEFYSGRWEAMDTLYRQNGYEVQWISTEIGAVGYNQHANGDVSLNAWDGWRLPSVLDNDIDKYIEILTYWAERVHQWNLQNGGRFIGGTVFTSNNDPANWKWFRLLQPNLNKIANHFKDWQPVPPQPPNKREILWQAGQENQVLYLYEAAALWRAINDDGFVPNSNEFEVYLEDQPYVAQQAESRHDPKKIREYYVPVGQWDKVEFEEYEL